MIRKRKKKQLICHKGHICFPDDDIKECIDFFIIGSLDKINKQIDALLDENKELICFNLNSCTIIGNGVYLSDRIMISGEAYDEIDVIIESTPIPVIDFYYAKRPFEVDYYQ